MFFRRVITQRNGKKYTYLKLIESYREGGKVKQRVIANLGNINHLDPEKVNTLIASLNKLTEPENEDCSVKAPGHRASFSHQPKPEELKYAWQQLKLSEFLSAAITSAKAPLLIQAMVWHKLIFPAEHRPLEASYKAIDLPELQNSSFSGHDFYRAVLSLARIGEQLESHLFKYFQSSLNISPLSFATLIRSQYTGNQCTLNNTGTSYQVGPYKQPVNLLVTLLSPGIPVSCSIWDRPPEPESITELQQSTSRRLGINTCLLADAGNFDGCSPPPDIPLIKLLSPENLADIPVSSRDLWQNKDAFTIDNTLWVKDISKPGKRYIICHSLHPHTAANRELEQKLDRVEQELKKICLAVKQGRLRREKTIRTKINKVLQQYGCQNYFTLRLNLENQDVTFSRNKEVIHKLKALQRTRVLETNMEAMPALDIVNIYQKWNALKEVLGNIDDPLKIPAIPPESHHTREYITGQALIQIICCTLIEMVSKQNT